MFLFINFQHYFFIHFQHYFFCLKINFQIHLKNLKIGLVILYYLILLQVLVLNMFITFSRNQSGSVNFGNDEPILMKFSKIVLSEIVLIGMG